MPSEAMFPRDRHDLGFPARDDEHITPYPVPDVVAEQRLRRYGTPAPQRFVAQGKEVLLDGAHYADAVDEAAAADIAHALNRHLA